MNEIGKVQKSKHKREVLSAAGPGEASLLLWLQRPTYPNAVVLLAGKYSFVTSITHLSHTLASAAGPGEAWAQKIRAPWTRDHHPSLWRV
eukprot:1162070-Pelagomonas_calceolata.AAC.8